MSTIPLSIRCLNWQREVQSLKTIRARLLLDLSGNAIIWKHDLRKRWFMKQNRFRKHISFLMVVVIFTISVTGFTRISESGESAKYTSYSPGGTYHSSVEIQHPSCPVDEHSVPDHCDSSCHCPSHAPLTVQPIQVICSQLITPFVFLEPFKALPEVYLPKFIPPDILV